MPRAAILYSSVTGNTRRVAEALAGASGDPVFPVGMAPDPAEFDILALGFWVRRGMPDEKSQALWRAITGKRVFFFGTMGVWPDSPHAMRCRAGAEALLRGGGNHVLGSFLCQGRVSPQVLRISEMRGNHPMTEERRRRLEEAAHHPDDGDLAAACRAWLEARSLAGCAACGEGREDLPAGIGVLPA